MQKDKSRTGFCTHVKSVRAQITPLLYDSVVVGKHGGSAVSPVTSQHERPAFDTQLRRSRARLYGLCMFSPSLCGFPPAASISPAIRNNVY